MIKNYFKIAFRHLIRHKAFSFINIAGLSIGMACSILILLWVRDELSYDRWHNKADHIFRLVSDAEGFKAAVSAAGMGSGLKNQMPEIKNSVRLIRSSGTLLEVGDKKFQEKRAFFADSTFLEIFSFPLLKGDPATALVRPDGILITEATAHKYFGQEDPMGKVLRKNNQETVIVTGVLADPPANSHLQFDVILPMSSIASKYPDLKNGTWVDFIVYTYLELDKSIDPTPAALSRLNARITKIYNAQVPDFKISWQLQPLTKIHLYSDQQIDLPGRGNIQYVTIFFVVALFILAVACINFMNLATARSARRAKEVGLRKVSGAGRGQLIAQFLGESLLISLLAFMVAMGMVWALLPVFNQLSGKGLTIGLFDGKLLAGLLGIALAAGLISGIYPALYLSGFKPAAVLKGKLRAMGGNLVFRNALVVTQFTVSIVLLVGTVVVYDQLSFIRNRNMGFDKRNLVYIPLNGDLRNKQLALETELKQQPLTRDYTIVSDLPTNLTSGTGDLSWEGKDPKSQVLFISMDVEEHFLDVFQVQLAEGRFFSPGFQADSNNYVVNEKAARIMGMSQTGTSASLAGSPASAIGKPLSFMGVGSHIIGVVKDFNFKPVQLAIEPMVLRLNKWNGKLVVRTQPGNTAATIGELEKITGRLNPAYPFDYNFLDQELANLYQGEQRMGRLFNIFAILAIFISCLGLYGLSAFIAEQRTREIGVRKVLGASVFTIVYLLSANFTRLILIAIAIAIPISWWAVNSWLKSFAFRTDPGWAVFLGAPFASLLLAWLTVSYESIRSATANPAKSLRAE